MNVKIKIKTSWILLGLLLAAVSLVWAASGDVLGVWYNEEKDAKIEIYKCGQKYCGKIVWLKEPNYLPASKDGASGTPKLDHNNPDPKLRVRPVLGLQIVHDLVFAGDSLWKDGKIYDPKSGKTYNAKITLESPNRLNLRGFVGVSLFGRTAIWTRAN